MNEQQRGSARFQKAERRQIEWRPFAWDQMLPDDHVARLVWEYVEGMDLTRLYEKVKAVEGRPGRDPIDPRMLFALWLLATVDGVGSARRLDVLCREHFAYLWILGGVTVNYHTLSDFRTADDEALDELLTQSAAALMSEGLVELNRVAQDGMRVRADAGAGSFRRRPTLEQSLAEAEQHLQELKNEADAESGGEESRRRQAARERAARERRQRIEAALAQREELAAKAERRKAGGGEEARASTTDPEARKMKMGDGGFRPAFNVQFATTADSLVIVGVDVNNAGTDGGRMQPMVDQLDRRYGKKPKEYLADGGFVSLDDITSLTRAGVTPYLPIMEKDKKLAKGVDPHSPLPGDTPEVAAWRKRMGTEEAKAVYHQRSATAEYPNAGCRNRGLHRFNVRGLVKAKCVALLQALAHNFQRSLALRRKKRLAVA